MSKTHPRETFELRNALNGAVISRHATPFAAGQSAAEYTKRIVAAGGTAAGCAFTLRCDGIACRRGSPELEEFDAGRLEASTKRPKRPRRGRFVRVA